MKERENEKNGGEIPGKLNHEYSITDEYEAMPSQIEAKKDTAPRNGGIETLER